jgi:hypothetical protein
LICVKAIGCQKFLWFEKGGQFSSATKTLPIFCTNLDVCDKHAFSKCLCHGSYCSSQALYVFPKHQGAPIE